MRAASSIPVDCILMVVLGAMRLTQSEFHGDGLDGVVTVPFNHQQLS